MRRMRILSVAVVALVGLIGIVPAVSAAPPADRVTLVGPIVDEVDCDGTSITRTVTGWFAGPPEIGDPSPYHFSRVYSNDDGQRWRYMDTGVIRTFERNGELYVSLSGRSVNVGPDGTGWIGHWQINTVTEEVWRAGLGVGDVDQLACGRLVSG